MCSTYRDRIIWLRFVAVFLIFCFCYQPLQSQERGSVIVDSSKVWYKSNVRNTIMLEVVDSTTLDPLLKSSVIIRQKNDSTIFSYDMEHKTILIRNLEDSLDITVRYMGYHTIHKKIMVKRLCKVIVNMSRKVVDLSAVTVRGKTLTLAFQGDTFVFKASLIKHPDGSTLRDVIEFMPGMKVTGNGLTFNGKPISTLYIDKSKLFGDNIKAALSSLTADDIINVQVYKENDEFDKLNKVKHPKKITVANVTTKRKRQYIKNMNLSYTPLSFFADSPSTQYNTSLTDNLVATRVGSNFSLNSNVGYNTNDNNGGFNANMMGDYSKSALGKYQYTTYAKLSYNNNHSLSWRLRDFLDPLSPITGQENEDIEKNNNFFVEIQQSVIQYLKDKSQLNTILTVDVRGNDNRESSEENKYGLDKELVNGVLNTTETENNSYNINLINKYRKYINKPDIDISNTAHITMLDVHDNMDRKDSMYISGGMLVNESSGKSKSLDLLESFSIRKNLFDHFKLSFRNTLSYTKFRRNYEYMDMMTLKIDTLLSKRYTVEEFANSISASVGTFGDGWEFNASVYRTDDVERRYEYFPEDFNTKRDKGNIGCSMTFGIDVGKLSGLEISFNRESGSITGDEYIGENSSMALTIDALRDAIVVNTPFQLICGDSKLKVPKINSLSLEYNLTTIKFGVLSTNISYIFTQDYIGHQKQYFGEDTYLEKYGYTALAGATLSTYRNIGTAKRLNFGCDYDYLIEPIKSKVAVKYVFDQSDIPYIILDDIHKNRITMSQMHFNFQSGFSSKVRVNLDYSYQLTQSNVAQIKSHDVRNVASCGVHLNLYKGMTTSVSARYENFHGSNSKNMEMTNWPVNVILGYRIKKVNPITFSVGMNDVFNQTKNHIVKHFDDYIDVTDSYVCGRILSFSIGWDMEMKRR